MWLKTAILVVFVALVVSLVSGLVFLMKDQGSTRRTMYSLGVRITLACILMALIGFGLVTGRLQSQAPWTAALEQAKKAEAQQ